MYPESVRLQCHFHMKTPLVLTLLQNLCCGLRLVHICNHGVRGFLFLRVLLEKHMKTQLILTILNLHLFSYLGFPKIPKTLLSHVCGGNAARHLFCFTSAAVLIIFFFTFSFASIYQPQSACQNQPTKRKFSQRTVKPQRR